MRVACALRVSSTTRAHGCGIHHVAEIGDRAGAQFVDDAAPHATRVAT